MLNQPSSESRPCFSICIHRLLSEIGFRHRPSPPCDADFWEPFHGWMLNLLGPMSSWGPEMLAELEHSSGDLIERIYPYASLELKLLFAKLSAMAILIDDCFEELHDDLVQFSAKLYRGEAQTNGLLALYYTSMQELSDMYGKDSVLRGLAIVPWMNFLDGCLMEKQVLTAERQQSKCENEDGLALKFPHYLRSKSGIAEAYAAGIFKITKDQYLPLTNYIRTLPEVAFYIEAFNDVLSFYKEEIAEETCNFIHLRTRSISFSGACGTNQWTQYDTLRLLCSELTEATHRIDALLRLNECERKVRGRGGGERYR
ncbi:Terpenoid synthase [Mycena sanguinolenta]|uniref:Terpenoid synthase n=1 Tax=Mycena sanguinolenta TaxID=230812 RepID=A0A8H6XMP6_9AGAR|nr:Terpenoid synthase [Mycena sanguinolenta]